MTVYVLTLYFYDIDDRVTRDYAHVYSTKERLEQAIATAKRVYSEGEDLQYSITCTSMDAEIV